MCVDPHDIPVLAIVDPDLMDGMPRSLKVATGLDALTHAIEGYITPGAWDLSDADVCTPGNPRPATREDIKALYTSLL